MGYQPHMVAEPYGGVRAIPPPPLDRYPVKLPVFKTHAII